MKNLLKLEELAMFGLACFAYTFLPFGWLTFLALFFLPDIGMLGYLAGPKTGALVYNLFHHKAIAVAIYFSGFWLKNDYLQLTGIILFAHASFDRVFGYGLKYNNSFNNTHLGIIGKAAKALD